MCWINDILYIIDYLTQYPATYFFLQGVQGSIYFHIESRRLSAIWYYLQASAIVSDCMLNRAVVTKRMRALV